MHMSDLLWSEAATPFFEVWMHYFGGGVGGA